MKGCDTMIIRLENHASEVTEEFKKACTKALEMCGLTAEGYAKLACPVDTGALRNSISHVVDESNKVCYIGSNMEYAPYVELGTGQYYSGGRKTPWVYQDGKGNWHYTRGQRAQPFLKPAVADHAKTYRDMIESELKGK